MAMYLMDDGQDSHGLSPKGIVVVQQPEWLKVGHISCWKGQSELG